jgi:hypothetical protein
MLDDQYVEATDVCTMMYSMQKSQEATYTSIRQMRDEYKADLVGLIVGNRNESCGCGSLPMSWQWSGDTSNLAYFVATVECATDNLSFAHEIGHAFVSK